MTLLLCHGETSPDVMADAIVSMRHPRKIVTMDALWWEMAAYLGIPRYFFKDKLAMMQFCLKRRTVALIVNGDKNPDTWSMAASMEAMGVVIFPVMHTEVT